jgi:hypothetical protein
MTDVAYSLPIGTLASMADPDNDDPISGLTSLALFATIAIGLVIVRAAGRRFGAIGH